MKKIFLILMSLFSINSQALVFNLPENGANLVGAIQTAIVQEDEDFSDIAERFDVGYYEVFEANPGVDMDNPRIGTVLVIPTQFILPPELEPGVVLVNLAEMRLYYKTNDSKQVYIFPVGIGKEDWNTPMGNMTIINKIKNPTWVVPQSIYEMRKASGHAYLTRRVPPGPDNPLGKYALRLSNQDYLIHGTNIPAGVGRRSSAGCIRMYEQDIQTLYGLVKVGTQVKIINQPYKAAWVGDKLYLEVHMPLLEQRLENRDDSLLVLNLIKQISSNRAVLPDLALVQKVVKERLSIPRIIYS